MKSNKCQRMSEIQAVSSTSYPDRSNSFSEDNDVPVCWICLDTAQLVQPCLCPRFAHAACLARWQLQSAGSRRETKCEFCDSNLPNWKHVLTPICGADAPAVMNVNFDNKTYSFEVKPGPDGYREFTEAIRGAFNLPDDSELNITFTCDEPGVPHSTGLVGVGSLITLQGAGAYDAAVHCASVSAARRTGQPGSSSPNSPASSAYSRHSESSQGSPSSSSAGSSHGSPRDKKRLSGIGRKFRSAIEYLTSSKH